MERDNIYQSLKYITDSIRPEHFYNSTLENKILSQMYNRQNK